MRPSQINISRGALQHNLELVKNKAGSARVMAIIKADAYGHGAGEVIASLPSAAGFGVSFIGEALALREQGVTEKLFVLQGAANKEELKLAWHHQLIVVCHSEEQLALLTEVNHCPECWIKVDTGMGRLGVGYEQAPRYINDLSLGLVGLMTHFACADDPDHELNLVQLDRFRSLPCPNEISRSVANSAALLALSGVEFDWVRPGLALYGSNPLNVQSQNQDSIFRPVMEFIAPLVSVRLLSKGDCVGYGCEWRCPEDMPVGIIAAGYADGYPRHAREGTPVWINGRRYPLIGRVSMDMICVDLRGGESPPIYANVELWGGNISVDEVAECAETIAYELLCSAGNSGCPRSYVA